MIKRTTGQLSPPVPKFDTAAPLDTIYMLNAHTLQNAWMYLDDMAGSVTPQHMIDNVAIQYGITSAQADAVYREWLKLK